MAARRTAEAVWEHDLVKGHGHVKGLSGGLPDTEVTWGSRTESSDGRTSPEELLAAAHASCYSMAFSAGLGRNGTPPERLEVAATVTFDKVGDGWKVTTSELTVKGKVPGITAEKFAELANAAKDGCPISGAIRSNVAVTLKATLA
ncbi:MAG: OsmC family peroxiredoxin [Thermoplasmata archaeon]|jgi:osmotically inducible protein OsmC|nr:OsmC family peroxiredoxin [Thermoplasmata archaeon]